MPPSIRRLINLLMNPWFIIGVGVFLLAVVSFLGVPMGNDEGIWGYMARIWLDHGLLPYRGAVEQKPPVIFLVYALSHLWFGINWWFPRVLAIIAIGVSGGMLYQITKRVSNKRAALLALAIFMLIMPIPNVNGEFVETETFMNLFRLAAFFFIIVAYQRPTGRKQYGWLVLSGLSFGLAIQSKQIVIVNALAILAMSIVARGRAWRRVAADLGLIALGVFGGMILALVPLLMSGGTVRDYIDGVWVVLFQPGLSAPHLGTRISGFLRHFFEVRLIWLSVGVVGFWFMREKLQKHVRYFWPLLLLAATDFLAYNAQGFYLDHHYKYFIPSWAILFGITIDMIIMSLMLRESSVALEQQERRWFMIVMIFLFIFYVPFEPGYYHKIRNYAKDLEQDNSGRDLGLWLKAHTRANETVYEWGEHGGPMYYYSARSAPGRHFSSYFLGVPNALAETQAALATRTPRYIVVPVGLIPPDWLQQFLAKRYQQKNVIFGATIYRLL